MPVYRDEKRGTWYVQYKTKDWKGNSKSIWKRGFSTKREATAWEVKSKQVQQNSIDLTLNDFIEEVYIPYITPRVKEITLHTKRQIYRTHIIPYLGDRKVSEITSTEILEWQNALMTKQSERTGTTYSKCNLRYINSQMKAIFTFAVRFYHLPENPVVTAGNMGSYETKEMKFLTLEQYKKLADALMDKPIYYYPTQVLYWTGLRCSEMMALELGDISFENRTISVTKTLCVIPGKEKYTTPPKTAESVRVVTIPEFLCDELKEYIDQIYKLNPTDRLFPVSKTALRKAIKKAAREAGVPEIRIHDLRHSHVSLLIHMGFTALAIAKRVGHSATSLTDMYSHLFPSVQDEMANTLNNLNKDEEDE